jgi:poly-gamma-glutamate synthesis protein (capsule biosynthesis protein)
MRRQLPSPGRFIGDPGDHARLISPDCPGHCRRRPRRAARGLGPAVEIVEQAQADSLQIVPGGASPIGQWTYAVVAPFPTVRDAMGLTELRSVWGSTEANRPPVYASAETVAAMQPVLGEPGVNVRTIDNLATMLDSAWEARPSLAIVPFESLEPRWKVLELDGRSPVRKDFDPATYPLQASYGLTAGTQPPALQQGWKRRGHPCR